MTDPGLDPNSLDPQAMPNDSKMSLTEIRQKLQAIAQEYAEGKINPAQFNALYRYYTEKRQLIELLVARDPDSDAWKVVAKTQHTNFLKNRFESRPMYYLVARYRDRQPLMSHGRLPQESAHRVFKLLQSIWNMGKPDEGHVCRRMDKHLWLMLSMGQWSLTVVIFQYQPSSHQFSQVKDLHSDFERANAHSLQRDTQPENIAERLVYPQRALDLEES